MSLNGKRGKFEIYDFSVCAKNTAMKRGQAKELLREVQRAVSRWKEFSDQAGVPNEIERKIAAAHRTGVIL